VASHLEALIHEYLEWQGYLVRRNVKVGRRAKGGWEMELDLIGYNPVSLHLVHYEPSLDALSWDKREPRFTKKFTAAKKYLFTEIFPWLPANSRLEQYAVLPDRPQDRTHVGGGTVIAVDRLVADIRAKVVACGVMSRNAIPEGFPLLRTIQLSHTGYFRERPGT
jgi:hypothetical protein